MGGYLTSALWQNAYYRLIWIGLMVVIVGGALVVAFATQWYWGLLIGYAGIALVALWSHGEARARKRAYQRGFRALYVVPGAPQWTARRLHALGYTGPVAATLWETHVNEHTSWVTPPAAGGPPGGDPHPAIAAFREAYTADRLRWLAERPDDVALVISTYNHLPPAQWAALNAAGAWHMAAPLHPGLLRVVTAARQRQVQRRMFGAVVNPRPRSDPTTWTTIYVPPRCQAQGSAPSESPAL